MRAEQQGCGQVMYACEQEQKKEGSDQVIPV